jgi:hypothetical protein
MTPTIEGFAAWLTTRGRADTTVAAYSSQIRRAQAGGNLLGAVSDRRLAPKTRRQACAAVRAWAKYTGDTHLTGLLAEIAMPPPDRVAVRRPLKRLEWEALKLRLTRDPETEPTVRAALQMVVVRGLRVGDVLRMTRTDVGRALRIGRLRFLAKGNKWIELNAAPVADCLRVLDATPWGEAVNVAGLILGKRGDGLKAYYAARRRLARALRRIGKNAGLDASELYPHRLRRTVVVELLTRLKGDPLAAQKAQQYMGWRGKTTIQEYIDYVGRTEIDALDGLFE